MRDAGCVVMPEHCVDKERAIAIKARGELEPAGGVPAGLWCYTWCTLTWMDCVKSCEVDGGIKYCRDKCNCNLFSDPNSQCRKVGG